MQKEWNRTLNQLSGNLTTNEYMPKRIKDMLLNDDRNLSDKFSMKEINFSALKGYINQIKGLSILSGLQKLKKDGYLTVFRAIRFPTNKRMFEMIYKKGCTIPNFEQDRILELYRDKEYIKKRNEIKKNRNFWVQPQERVVKGLPVFRLVNDAIQIHHAFRHMTDQVLIIAIYISKKIIKTRKISLIANSAIDLDYDNTERDFEITDYIYQGNQVEIDLDSLLTRGVDLHEMYIKSLPCSIQGLEKYGIKQDYFLLNIYEIEQNEEIKKLHQDKTTLLKNSYFLHGFFGDQNVFGRRPTRYLPFKCRKIEKIK